MAWEAAGLLFENCNCTLVCPGHVHFEQDCTHPRCIGWWAVAVAEGRFGEVDLAGARAVVTYDSPQRMIDGGWTERLILDQDMSAAQRDAVERILTGKAGGPWARLAPFVGTWEPARVAPIVIEDEPAEKRVRVKGVLDGVVKAIRGRDRSKPVTFENMFNQIHPPTQTVARGTTQLDDGTIRVTTDGTHGLWSRFHWRVDDDA